MKKIIHHQKRGFTLIELLVAMVVLVILATIGLVMYNAIWARSKAKNSKVVHDFELLRKGMVALYAVDGEFPGEAYSNAETYAVCSTPPCPVSQSNWEGVMAEISAMSIVPPKDGVYCLYLNSRSYDKFLFTFAPFENMDLPESHDLFTETIGKKLDPGGAICGTDYKFIGGINDKAEGVAYNSGFYEGHCPGPCRAVCDGTPYDTTDASPVSLQSYCVLEEAPQL